MGLGPHGVVVDGCVLPTQATATRHSTTASGGLDGCLWARRALDFVFSRLANAGRCLTEFVMAPKCLDVFVWAPGTGAGWTGLADAGRCLTAFELGLRDMV